MKITINGEEKDVPAGLTVRALLDVLAIHGDRVAIEHNLDVLSRDKWDSTRVQPGDRFEIVHFVGGG